MARRRSTAEAPARAEASAGTTAAAAPKRNGQAQLPGFKPQRIAEIEDAAHALKRVRDQRMELTQKEIEAADKLIDVMKKHQVPAYKLDDEFDVKLKPGKDRVSITRAKDEASSAVDEAAEDPED